jgi:ATP-binding cassette subfamily B protein
MAAPVRGTSVSRSTEPDSSTPRALATFLSLGWRTSPWRVAASLLPLGPIFTGVVLLVVGGLVRQATFSWSVGALLVLVTLTLGWTFSSVASLLSVTLRIGLGELLVYRVDRDLIEIASTAPTPDALRRPEAADDLEVLRRQQEALGQGPYILGTFIDGLAGTVLASVLFALVTPALFILPLAAIPALALPRRWQRRAAAEVLAGASMGRQASHLFQAATTPTLVMELRAFGSGRELLRIYDDLSREATERERTARASVAVVTGLAGAATVLVFGAVISWLLIRGATDVMTAADIFLLIVASTLSLTYAAELAGGTSEVRQVLSTAECLARLRQVSDRKHASHTALGQRIPPGDIVLDEVSYRYNRDGPLVLDRVSISIPSGSVVAVVGENGAGKSTLVHLLLGLAEPTEGTMWIGETRLSEDLLLLWRAHTSACFQDFVRYELRLRLAVGIGDLKRIEDEKRILEVLELAGAIDLPDRLPAGLDWELGGRSGRRALSGGQWQRLAVARSLMREHCNLLALDEPTSALDALTERDLVDRYILQARSIAKDTGRTTVVVSHRLSTVRAADLIVVLGRGRVIEVGDHRALLAADGEYANLYNMQANMYR